uniref:SMP-30/Gluconolactonase/LRE-like region domain-containing protein n=1 Tax=Leersia perrieri TaxID=77586 RepID=A0A0D9WP55_9ORYZ
MALSAAARRRRSGGGGAAATAVLVAALLLTSSSTASAASSYPAKVVTGLLSSTASAVVKQLWSLKSKSRTGSSSWSSAAAGRSVVKYEGGYAVETVFDGSKLGIEPYDVEVTPAGELLVLDSMNSNVYRVQLPLSRYSRPKLVAGSPEGLSGHVDGRLREAKMNHPKGFTVDDRGNIYVADAMNMAIRKISDTGVTTIAGGKSMRGGHLDGPSDDAKFSTDFEIRYISSSCSLLVIDRGNQAIREIALHNDDCEYQYEAGFPLGIALLFAAGFFGYMLALLQRRVLGMVSTADEPQTPPRPSVASIPPYQKPLKPSFRPPLIPTEDQAGKHEAEEGFFTSVSKLIGGAKSSVVEIFSRKKRPAHQYHHHLQQQRTNPWPVQESYAIPHDETPPPLDMRAPTPRKNYAFMTKEPEKVHHVRHGRPYFNGWDVQHAPQQQPEQQMYHQQHLQQHRQYSEGPQTFYEQSCETTNEIVFGAVQEVDTKRRMVEIKAVNYGDTFYEQYGMRYRNNYIGYNNSSSNGNNNYY